MKLPDGRLPRGNVGLRSNYPGNIDSDDIGSFLSITVPLAGAGILASMKADTAHLNLLFAWLWILFGFLSGMILGLFFHREHWLGGYGSFRRRMYRLAHISFFGLGALNLLFWLTIQRGVPLDSLGIIASVAFILGGVTMPVCCVLMAHFPKARFLFGLPVCCLIIGGALSLLLICRNDARLLSAGNPAANTCQTP